MNWLFASDGQSIGASASVLPMNIQGWFPLGLIGLISLQSTGLSRVFSSTTIQKHQIFTAQPSSLVAQMVKRLPAMREIWVQLLGWEDPGEGNGNPLQYSCLENPINGGAWQATVHGVAKSRTRLSNFTFTFSLLYGPALTSAHDYWKKPEKPVIHEGDKSDPWPKTALSQNLQFRWETSYGKQSVYQDCNHWKLAGSPLKFQIWSSTTDTLNSNFVASQRMTNSNKDLCCEI